MLYLLTSTGEAYHRRALPSQLTAPHSAVLSVQGVRLSCFLETSVAPGQRTLSGYLHRQPAQSAALSGAPGTPPEFTDRQGWKQTFLDAQTRQAIAQHMQELRQWKAENPGAAWPGHVWHDLPGSGELSISTCTG